ncbi:uncharacterized protein LOC132270931 isoform X2 [Cornus florida]|uniref:uncharacterized protein LOC132270931 isoform X2 n=1 Tax=Cornus florida TaxID=4283 RepID=UPI00289B6CAE|nr:uncharacterized protein LOC132270931 isoform X2 [Cornus florida]
MASSKTFDLKLYCTCDGCKKKVKKVLKNDRGVVHSSEIDTNERKVTISGTTDPHTLIAAFGKAGKKVELLTSEQFSSGENNQLQNMEIVPTKSAKGVLDSDHQRTIAELQQFSKNNQRSKLGPRPSMAEHQQFFQNNQRSKLKEIVDHDALRMTTGTKNQTSHKHELELKSYEKRFTCNGCKQEGLGPRYRCKHCDYELHKECRNPKLEISHEFLKGHTLEFLDQLPSKCSTTRCIACGSNICGSLYHNKAKELYLHPCCSNLKSKLCIDGAIFKLRNEVVSKCMWCKKKEPRRHKTDIRGWSYISDCKEYQIHVYCVTEMVHEAWKKEKIDLQLLPNSKKNQGKLGFKTIRKIVEILLKSVVGVLFGDPLMIIASVVPSVVELISNN